MATYIFNHATNVMPPSDILIYPGDTITIVRKQNGATTVIFSVSVLDPVTLQPIDIVTETISNDPYTWSWVVTSDVLIHIPTETGTMRIRHYDVGILANNSYRQVGVPTSEIPTITSAALQESTATAAYATQFGKFIQNRSILAVKINAQASLGTKITRVDIFNGADTSGTFLGGGDITPVETLTDYIIAETTPITTTSGQRTIRVTDKRGRTATQTISFTALPNQLPSITGFTVTRTDVTGVPLNTGSYMRYHFEGFVQSLKPDGETEKNQATLALQYRPYGTADPWQNIDVPVTNGNILLDAFAGTGRVFSPDITYSFQAVLTDYFGNVIRTASLPKAFRMFNGHPSGTGFAIGGMATAENHMDVFLPTDFDKNVGVRGSMSVQGALTLASFADPASVLGALAPYCLLTNPAADALTYKATLRWFPFNWGNMVTNGDYQIKKGGASGDRNIGIVVPADGVYEITGSIYLTRASANSGFWYRIEIFAGSTVFPVRDYYLSSDDLIGTGTGNTDQGIPSWSGTNTMGIVWGAFVCSAGDIILPYGYMNDVTKDVNQKSRILIRRIG